MIRVYRIGKPIILEHFDPFMTYEDNWKLYIAPRLEGYPHVVKANTGYQNDYIAYTDAEWEALQ